MSKSHPNERHIPSSVVFGDKITKNSWNIQIFVRFFVFFVDLEGFWTHIGIKKSVTRTP